MKSDQLINASIPKLLRLIAIPACVGFFFNTMYNVVDTWVAGKISGEALAAISLTFPVFFIIIAISMGIGTGVTALISNELGSQNKNKAQYYATQTLSFGIVISLFLTVAGYIFSPALFKLLGASGSYLTSALSYMQPVFLGSIFISMIIILNGILNAVGDTKPYRNVLIAGFFINLLLSPALAFGWLNLPTLGILGIAIATIVSNFLGLIYIFYKVWKTKLINTKDLKSWFKPKLKAYKDIATQGIPTGFSMMTVAIGAFIITYFVSQFGENAVAGYGAAIRIEQILLIPSIGINIAVLTLIGQNNGAKLLDRVHETAMVGLKYTIIISTIGSAVILLGSKYLMTIFTDIEEIINYGVGYLMIAALMTWGYGIIFVTEAILRGLKKPIFPFIIGTIRQIILPLPVFYIVTSVLTFNIIGLWWSIFAIVWISALVSLYYVYRELVLKN